MTDEFSAQERAAVWERAQAALDSTAGIKEQLRERQARAGRGERGWSPPMQPDPVPAPQRARERPRQQPPGQSHEEWSAGWNAWAQKIADQRSSAALDKFSEDYTKVFIKWLMEHLQERFTRGRQMTNDRVKEAEDAAMQLIAGLEARIAELEKRAILKPVRPQLVSDGGSDAGD